MSYRFSHTSSQIVHVVKTCLTRFGSIKAFTLEALARTLGEQSSIGVDTEFLRRAYFFSQVVPAAAQRRRADLVRRHLARRQPRCLDAGADRAWIAQTHPLPRARISRRLYLTSRAGPVPGFRYADRGGLHRPQAAGRLCRTRQDAAHVAITKGQTRTDWSKRPLTHAQLEYAADDVFYLGAIADELTRRLTELGREHWVREDCLELEDRRLYETGSGTGVGCVCAGSASWHRSPARGPKPLPSGVKSWRASAICRAPGSCPTPPFLSSRTPIRKRPPHSRPWSR